MPDTNRKIMQQKKVRQWTKWPAVIIVLAAIFMEAILAFQYNYARAQLEEELERSTLMDLITSALRIQEVLSKAEVAVSNELVHAEKQIDDPQYMQTVLHSLVQNDKDNIDGAFLAFKPDFYPQEGHWFEPYVRQKDGKVELFQMGSPEHDYTQREFYRMAMEEDVPHWTDPYWDGDGACNWVITYSLPIKKNGQPVGVIGVDLTTTWINDVVNYYHPHPSSFSIVLTEDGKFISAPTDSVASEALVNHIVALFNDSAVERKVVGVGRITRFKFYDPEYNEYGRVYYASKKSAPHWQILLVCYDSEIFGELVELRREMFLWALLGVAILTLIVWLFRRESRKLQESQLSQERIGAELRVANEIQQSMLPHHMLQLDDVHIYGRLVPAREVGGDLYDYFVRDGKLFFCIGDVSGKGAPSAMLMAVTHSLFRSASAHETNPARIMQTINEASAEGNEKNMFVTMFIGVLDLPTGHLRYSNAGHDNPIVISNGQTEQTGSPHVQQLECDANLPVGVFADTKYTMQNTMIEAGSTLFLYTDGLTEAKNVRRELYGEQRVMQVMIVCASEAMLPKQIIDTVSDGVHTFVGEAEQSDDLTMLAIRYTPARYKSILTERFTLQNDVHEVTRFGAFIKHVTDQLSIEKSLAGQLRLAIEEAVVNVIDYAYPAGTDGEIDVHVESDGQTLRVIISDSGVPFDPTVMVKADTTLSAEDRQIGGLGILLVRELMDSINYERTDGRNVLTLVKALHPES